MESKYIGITQEFFDRINLEILEKEADCFNGEDCQIEINSLRATIGEYDEDDANAPKPATIVKMKGNALDTDCEVLCHQVNLYKNMGGGIARQIADRFPEVEREYRNFDKAELGEVCFAKADNYYVANCYSEDDFETDYVALAKCFAKVNAYMDKHGLTTVAIPYHYGCGIANGDWNTVKYIISTALIGKTLKIYKLMTYSEYRAKFRSVEKFRREFGKLTEDEVHELLRNERCANFIKACVMTTWRSAKAEYEASINGQSIDKKD